MKNFCIRLIVFVIIVGGTFSIWMFVDNFPKLYYWIFLFPSLLITIPTSLYWEEYLKSKFPAK